MILIEIIVAIIAVRYIIRSDARNEYVRAKEQLERHYFDAVLGGQKPNGIAYDQEMMHIEKEIRRLR